MGASIEHSFSIGFKMGDKPIRRTRSRKPKRFIKIFLVVVLRKNCDVGRSWIIPVKSAKSVCFRQLKKQLQKNLRFEMHFGQENEFVLIVSFL